MKSLRCRREGSRLSRAWPPATVDVGVVVMVATEAIEVRGVVGPPAYGRRKRRAVSLARESEGK